MLPACQLLNKAPGPARSNPDVLGDRRAPSRTGPLGPAPESAVAASPTGRTGLPPDVTPPARTAETGNGEIQIRPANPPQAEISSPDSSPNLTTGPGTPKDNRQSSAVATRAAEKPAPDPTLVAALRCYLDNRPGDALPYLQGYDKPNQEMLIGLFALLVRAGGNSLNQASPQELAALVESLQSLAVPLRPRSQVGIDKMCFCAWSKGFGQYEPLEPGHRFRASLPGRLPEEVRIYVELTNLSSLRRENLFETRMASAVTIYDGKRRPVWHHDFQDRDSPIKTRSLTHDFSNSYGFSVPRMPPGEYRLVLQVVDVPTGRRAQRSLPFHVTTIANRDY
jgi:hypothetical protein